MLSVQPFYLMAFDSDLLTVAQKCEGSDLEDYRSDFYMKVLWALTCLKGA